MCGNVQFMREKNIYYVFIAECFNTFENDFWFILPAFALGLNEGVHLNDCEVALKTIKKTCRPLAETPWWTLPLLSPVLRCALHSVYEEFMWTHHNGDHCYKLTLIMQLSFNSSFGLTLTKPP